MSPTFRKYTRAVGSGSQVVYAICSLGYHYAPAGEDADRRRLRKVPVKMGYATRSQVQRWSMSDVADSVRAEHGDTVDLVRVHGFVQLKPRSERVGRYFTPELAAKAKKRKARRARKANPRTRARGL